MTHVHIIIRSARESQARALDKPVKKRVSSEEIAAQTAEFLARGGSIKPLEAWETGRPDVALSSKARSKFSPRAHNPASQRGFSIPTRGAHP